MKLLIYTCIHHREPITKLFLSNIELLRKQLPQITIEIAATITKGQNNPEITSRIDHVFFGQNHPLSHKFQHGVNQLRNIKFDYLMILGSDDLPNFHYILQATDYATDHAGAGCTDLYVTCSRSKITHYWKGYENGRKNETIGAGRTFTRNFCEKIDFGFWVGNPKNKGLDSRMRNNINKLEGCYMRGFKLLDGNSRMTDIKSNQNLGAFNKYHGIQVRHRHYFQRHYSTDIYNQIQAL